MEEDEGGLRLSKRFADKDGEVDYKIKAGTAWSHNFLNQKPWHPLSYPNQRRKWIAEQQHAQHQRRAEEVAREYAQEQEFFRQTSLISQKEKEKIETMQAVSFMYVRPPGYNPESAKAAEVADQDKELHHSNPTEQAEPSSSNQQSVPAKEEKKKPRPKDVFGRVLPTEEQFSVLKNAPRLETGVTGRAKPFAVELRNVKCLRCGTYGHQSGDRECPLKDAIMPSEESRLKRDDPLTTIMAQTESNEPLKWELKQKPGISPPRGGFDPDDPNQQIVAEDIFDEYGGFLGDGLIPELLTNVHLSKHEKKSRRKSKKKEQLSEESASDSDDGRRSSKRKDKVKHKRSKKKKDYIEYSQENNTTSDSDVGHQRSRRKQKGKSERSKKRHNYFEYSLEDNSTSDGSDCHQRSKRKEKPAKSKKRRNHFEYSQGDDSTSDEGDWISRKERKHRGKKRREYSDSSLSVGSDNDRRNRTKHRSSDLSDHLHLKHSSQRLTELRTHEEKATGYDYDQRISRKKMTSRRSTRSGYHSESSQDSDVWRYGNRSKHKSH